MFGGKKAKELEEELLALQEKQNRLQERISNITKAKDKPKGRTVALSIALSFSLLLALSFSLSLLLNFETPATLEQR